LASGGQRVLDDEVDFPGVHSGHHQGVSLAESAPDVISDSPLSLTEKSKPGISEATPPTTSPGSRTSPPASACRPSRRRRSAGLPRPGPPFRGPRRRRGWGGGPGTTCRPPGTVLGGAGDLGATGARPPQEPPPYEEEGDEAGMDGGRETAPA